MSCRQNNGLYKCMQQTAGDDFQLMWRIKNVGACSIKKGTIPHEGRHSHRIRLTRPISSPQRQYPIEKTNQSARRVPHFICHAQTETFSNPINFAQWRQLTFQASNGPLRDQNSDSGTCCRLYPPCPKTRNQNVHVRTSDLAHQLRQDFLKNHNL